MSRKRNDKSIHLKLNCIALICMRLIVLTSTNQLLHIGAHRGYSNKKFLYGDLLSTKHNRNDIRMLHKTMMQEIERKKVEHKLRTQKEKEANVIRKYLSSSLQGTSILKDFHTLRF